MKHQFRSILLITFSVFSGTAASFEISTHAAMTRAAIEKSVLNDANFRSNLGLHESKNPFGDMYFDVAENNIKERKVSDIFEGVIIEDTLKTNPLSITGWLMRGAIREDDLGYLLGRKIGDNPHDDPYGDFFRVFNHFFDPYYDQALSYVPGAKKNPNWAIGSSNAFTDPNTPESGRRNHFTVFDAREAMYRALTGKKQDGTNANPSASADDTNPAPATVRKTYWATTFRALGDILHLNQDMAQPQHTRDEPHSG